MRSEKGITLTSLVATVIVLSILASVATFSGLQAYRDAQIENYVAKMKVIQRRVDLISDGYKIWANKNEPGNNMGDYLKSQYGIETKLRASGDYAMYSVVVEAGKATSNYYYFTPTTIETQLGVSTLKNDNLTIAVDFVNREVYELKGIKDQYDEVHHSQYTLPGGDTLINLQSETTVEAEINYNISVKNYGNYADIQIKSIKTLLEQEAVMNGYEYAIDSNTASSEWIKVEDYDSANGCYVIHATKTGVYYIKEFDSDVLPTTGYNVTIVNPPIIPDNEYFRDAQKIIISNNGVTETSVNASNIGDWFDYSKTPTTDSTIDANRWANIRVGDDYWVWIPRFAEKNKSSSSAQVEFVKDISYTSTKYTALPTDYNIADAFKAEDNDGKEITGFWVQKFMASYGGSSQPGSYCSMIENNTDYSRPNNSNAKLISTKKYLAIADLGYARKQSTIGLSALTPNSWFSFFVNNSPLNAPEYSNIGNASGIYSMVSGMGTITSNGSIYGAGNNYNGYIYRTGKGSHTFFYTTYYYNPGYRLTAIP